MPHEQETKETQEQSGCDRKKDAECDQASQSVPEQEKAAEKQITVGNLDFRSVNGIPEVDFENIKIRGFFQEDKNPFQALLNNFHDPDDR